MWFLVDFGYIKKANKQLKNLYELSGSKIRNGKLDKPTNLGEYVTNITHNKKDIKLSNLMKETVNDTLKNNRQNSRYWRGTDADKDILKKKYKLEKGTPKQDQSKNPNFTDIRKTDDSAASKNGYLGFRTDPYKGYGGMMEETVPDSELLQNKVWKRSNILKDKYRGKK